MSNLNESMKQFVDEVLEQHSRDCTQVIAIMQDIQAKYRYLPAETLRYVAKEIGVSTADIFGVATFYENFSLEPKGKFVIKCCDGTACHVRKSDAIAEELYKLTGTSPDKTTSDDLLFTVERVSCLGACGLAPVCTVNDSVHAAMTPEKVKELIDTLRKENAEE
ncbi:MAG: NAD(P)H-dependent oxidoreductase subunit E [Oscillospiraceae bacterium]|nr:NAD(P)H-dependent oxidoreductase subunit E [Oscillospiraceae bacterium]